MKPRFALFAAAVALAVAPCAPAAVYLDENFATFADGPLVGQNGWTQHLAESTNPIQIIGGRAVMAGNTANNQDAAKSFTPITAAAGRTFYAGYRLQVNGPGNNGATFTSSYFTGLLDQANFVDTRVGFVNIDGTQYQVSARVNGQSSNPFTPTGPVLAFGAEPISIVLGWTFADSGAGTPDRLSVWVNPGSLDAAPAVTLDNLGTPISTGFASVILSQFTFSSDISIERLTVTDTFGESFALVAVPEPHVATLLAAAGLGLVAFGRRKAGSRG